MKVVIIIPTYNEKENVGPLIEVLEKTVFPKIDPKWNMNILFVDDTSPDGTADEVRKKMKEYKNVDLVLNNQKVGLGGAYMKGMSYAVEQMKADLLMEMDADFQHDENLIPAFLQKIDEGADMVVGSRYMKGGSIPKYWGISRKVISIGGNLFIRTMMLDTKIHDWTTGFRALKPWVFEKVKGSITELKTYSFQTSFLYFARKVGAKLAEVPLNFKERKWGKSKLPGIEGTLKTFWFVIKVRILDFIHSRFFKFGTVGFIGYLVTAFSLYFLSKSSLPEWAVWALATEVGIINNFTLNNIWTFKDAEIKGFGHLVGKFLQFNLTSSGAIIIQTLAGTVGVGLLGPQYRQLILPLTVVFLVMPYNYIIYNLVIWKTKLKVV